MKRAIFILFAVLLSSEACGLGHTWELPEGFFLEYIYSGSKLLTEIRYIDFYLKGSSVQLTIKTLYSDRPMGRKKTALFFLEEEYINKIYRMVEEGGFFELPSPPPNIDLIKLSAGADVRKIQVGSDGKFHQVRVYGDVDSYTSVVTLEQTILEVLDETQSGWRVGSIKSDKTMDVPDDFYLEYSCEYNYGETTLSTKIENFRFIVVKSIGRLTINSVTDQKGGVYIEEISLFPLEMECVDKLYRAVVDGGFFGMSVLEEYIDPSEVRTILVVADGEEYDVQVSGEAELYPAIATLERAILEVLDQSQPGWR